MVDLLRPRFLREPLLHFFIVGGLLFVGGQAWRQHHDAHRIVVTPARIAELAEKHRLQVGARPTEAELATLVQAYVREEALYREGRILGLDRDDEVVRRRVAQKVEFLNQDRALPAAPTEARLRAWFAEHRKAYVEPVRTNFRHLYFSPDAVGDALIRAKAALAAMKAGRAETTVGADLFPDQPAYARLSRDEARRIFGDTELPRRLDAAPSGAWSGPYRSGYGWHLVMVESREAAHASPFEKIEGQVQEDYLRDAARRANAAAIDRVVRRYRVAVEGAR